MKKLLLLLLLTDFGTTAASAQAPVNDGPVAKVHPFRLGVKGGYNLDGLRGDADQIEREDRHDFHAGLYGQLDLNRVSSIQAELLYSRMGFGGTAHPGGASENYRMDYLMLPVLYVRTINKTFSLHVGPQLSILEQVVHEGEALSRDTHGFSGRDYGAVLGAEAYFGRARAGVRQTLSLNQIFADDAGSGSVAEHFQHADLYHNLFQLYVGFDILH